MASQARLELGARLGDVNRLVKVHQELTGSNAKGRKATHGPAVTKAGVVLLTAATEAFVEELYEEAGNLLFAALPETERASLYKETSRRLNAANVKNTNLLFFNLGIPWVLAKVKWQKFSNASFTKALDRLVEVRGQIAHGKQPHVALNQLKAWRRMVQKYAEVLERVIADEVETRTGIRPAW